MTVRLASYNIHKCLGLDRRRRPGRIVAVLNALQADIVALQEVDHRLAPRRAALPRALLSHETDLAVLPFALGEASLGWHGQVILVRRCVTVTAVLRLQLPGLEPRGAVLAELALPGGAALRVVGVHLGLVRRYRLMQLDAIRVALSRRAPMATAVLGDFNEWSQGGGTATLGAEFRVHAPGPSFPALRPVAALDRIALGPGLHLRAAGVLRAAPARIASDHLPVWADLAVDRAVTPAPAAGAAG